MALESLLTVVLFLAVFLIPAAISYLVYKKLKFNKFVNIILSILLFIVLVFALTLVLFGSAYHSAASVSTYTAQ